MKPLVIFLLTLFAQLLGSSVQVRAAEQAGMVKAVQQNPAVQSSYLQAAQWLPAPSDITETKVDFVALEDEDDDEDMSGKDEFPGSCFIACFDTFYSGEINSCLDDNLSFYKQLSYLGSSRYIVQRALRI